jgi:hypothetical protein
MHELEVQAQRAAEFRLAAANEFLWLEEEGEFAGIHDEARVAPDLAGPYCGCDTCLVREVLDAAWPVLYRLAHDPDVPVPYWPADE